jgi:glycosyltransferase involved in cell wall biosynthesis
LKKLILIFYDHFYPAYKAGGPVQSLVNLVRQLSEEYDFYIVCKPHEMNEQELLKTISINEWNNWEDKAKLMYWNYSWNQKSEIKKFILEIKPAVIYINGLFSLYFNILPLIYSIQQQSSLLNYKIVLSSRGMLHTGALSQKKFKKSIFLFLFRFFNWQKKVRWHATDEQEALFIKQKFGNGVEVAVAGNFPNLLQPISSTTKKRNELVLGTIALISPMKNHLQVLNALMEVKGSVQWHIYGPVKDEQYWEACKKQITFLPASIQVYYHNDMPPDQLSKAMEQFQVFIMPSKSENFGHAIAEALSAGKPVITTTTTPFNDLEKFKAGYSIELHELKSGLVNSIQQLIDMDEQAFAERCINAKKYADEKFKIYQLVEQYQRLFQ